MNSTINKSISIKRVILYIIEITSFFAIHDTEFIVIALYEAKPLVTIPIAIFIAIYEKTKFSIIIGAICGLLVDISINAKFGLGSLILCIICFITAKIFNNIFDKQTGHFFIYMIINAITILVISYITFAFSPYVFSVQYFSTLYVPNALYTILVSPVLYVLNTKICFKVR